jgi:hypothetical protein
LIVACCHQQLAVGLNATASTLSVWLTSGWLIEYVSFAFQPHCLVCAAGNYELIVWAEGHGVDSLSLWPISS